MQEYIESNYSQSIIDMTIQKILPLHKICRSVFDFV